jgi:hypothetical protein
MPKMLINAQKEQICRWQGLLGYGEIMVKCFGVPTKRDQLITFDPNAQKPVV